MAILDYLEVVNPFKDYCKVSNERPIVDLDCGSAQPSLFLQSVGLSSFQQCLVFYETGIYFPFLEKACREL